MPIQSTKFYYFYVLPRIYKALLTVAINQLSKSLEFIRTNFLLSISLYIYVHQQPVEAALFRVVEILVFSGFLKFLVRVREPGKTATLLTAHSHSFGYFQFPRVVLYKKG